MPEVATVMVQGQQFKLGRIRPKAVFDVGGYRVTVRQDGSHSVSPMLDNHFAKVRMSSQPPDAVDYSAKAMASISRMYLNDQLGCCLPPGTLIRMADGTTKKIEEVSITDSVMTAEGNTSPVTALSSRYENSSIIQIVAWGHSHLQLTAEHPVLTKRGYVSAGELQSSDLIAQPVREVGRVQSIKTRSYLSEDSLYGVKESESGQWHNACVAAQGKAIATALRKLPETIDLTSDFGRVIGLFLSEGSTSRNIVGWTFCTDERDTFVAEIQRLMLDMFGVETRVLDRGNGSLHIRFCSKVWQMLFESLCGKGAEGKRLHTDLLNGPQGFLQSVLSGWLDGDGQRKRGVNTGVTVSHALALDMLSVAHTLGMKAGITDREPGISWAPNGPDGVLVPIDRKRSWIVAVTEEEHVPSLVSFDKINQKWIAWSYNEGKRKNLGRFKDKQEAMLEAHTHRHISGRKTVRGYREGNTIWRRVRTIEKEPYSGRVFNLEVAGDNSYVAEGIGVHNCVISGKLHQLGIWSGNDSDHTPPGVVLATDQEVQQQYVGICGPGDQGCNITTVLDHFKSQGMQAGGQTYTIDGYVAVDWTNQLMVKVAIDVFGSLTLGINLPSAWTQGGNGSLWDLTTSPIVGGHDVCCVGYSTTGVVICTWAGTRIITWPAFLSKQWLEECYVELAPLWYGNDKLAPNGIDAKTLKADLDLLAGGGIPDPGPGPVVPPVVPPIVPPPLPPVVPPSPQTLFTLTLPRSVPRGGRVVFNAPMALAAGKYGWSKASAWGVEMLPVEETYEAQAMLVNPAGDPTPTLLEGWAVTSIGGTKQVLSKRTRSTTMQPLVTDFPNDAVVVLLPLLRGQVPTDKRQAATAGVNIISYAANLGFPQPNVMGAMPGGEQTVISANAVADHLEKAMTYMTTPAPAGPTRQAMPPIPWKQIVQTLLPLIIQWLGGA